jgi:hypothetical protein
MGLCLPKLPPHFIDPITGYPPRDETQMSGLLALFHQTGRVAWNKVHLRLPSNTPSDKTAGEIFKETAVCSEYRLFWQSKDEERIWGSMPADLIFWSAENQSVAIIENKIGSGFTGAKDDAAVGQLAKQADFLMHSRIPNCFLILLSTAECFDKKPWYYRTLEKTLKCGNRSARVKGYLMLWDEILLAAK